MGFLYAIEGIIATIRSEAHLRFHLAIANLISVFAWFYGISKVEWAILVLTIFTVISAEIVNTAIERTVDTATSEIMPTAKLAKDAAAGAVLCLCVGAIIVGICLFGNISKIQSTIIHIFTNFKILVPCLVLGTLDVLFLIFGGKNDRKL